MYFYDDLKVPKPNSEVNKYLLTKYVKLYLRQTHIMVIDSLSYEKLLLSSLQCLIHICISIE